MNHQALTHRIIGCAIRVHNTLGPGFLEQVYHRAMEHELRKAGIPFESECLIEVIYDGVSIGSYRADILVQGRVLLELKAITALTDKHTAQLINYLTATGIEDGLLFNFGKASLEYKRKFRTYRPKGK